MANMMDIKVLGVVENYSYLACPDCGKVLKPFGESNLDEVAKELNMEVLGKMPLDPEFAKVADAGKIYTREVTDLDKAVDVLKALDK